MKLLLLPLFICCQPHFLSAQSGKSIQADSTVTREASPPADTPAAEPERKGWKSFLERAPAVRIGARLGINGSNMNFNKGYPAPTTPVESSWKMGYTFGALLQVPFNNRLSIQQEYLYSQLRGADRSIGATYKLAYFSFPLLLKYKIIKNLSLLAGPQFALLLQAKQKLNGQSTDISHNMEDRNFGATAGLEIRLTNHISTTARYTHGINHVSIGKWASPKEFKHERIQLTLDFKL